MENDENINGLIYLVKNKINSKCYIGQTIRTFEERKKQHIQSPQINSAIDRAIKKYGSMNFEWSIVCKDDTQNKLNFLESFYISKYYSKTTEWGYNIRGGGSTGKLGESTKQKLREINLGKKLSKETVNKIVETRRGYKHSQNTKNKMSESHKGEKHHYYGKHLTEEHKKRIGKSLSRKFKGIKKSRESIIKRTKSSWGKYPGTSYKKSRNPEKKCWYTSIQFNGKKKSLGCYEDPITGSLVYNIVWKEIYEKSY